MRTLFVLTLLSIVSLLAGCTRTQPERILSENWGVGQHQDCISKGQTLYCIEPSALGKRYVFGKDSKKAKEVPPEQVLFNEATVSTYDIDQEVIKDQGKAKRDYDQGTYDTKFSVHTVSDYSIWDCLKTGVAAPGISCQLLRPRTKSDDNFLSEQTMNLKQSEMLKGLTLELMLAQCGQPEGEAKNSIEKISGKSWK